MAKTAQHYNTPINERLRELVNAKNIKPFADALGISQDAVRQWTSGYARPSIDKLGDIAKFFEVSTDWLLGLAGARRPENLNVVEELGLSEETVDVLRRLREGIDAFRPFSRRLSDMDFMTFGVVPIEEEFYKEGIAFLNSYICSLVESGTLLNTAEYIWLYRDHVEDLMDREIAAGRLLSDDTCSGFELKGGKVLLTTAQSINFLGSQNKEALTKIFDDYCSEIWFTARKARPESPRNKVK